MISSMLKPFFKKFIGLFISMVFVSMLSIGLLSTFASTIYNLKVTFKTYLADYGDVDAVVNVGFTDKSNFSDITNVDGVKKVDYRITMDSFLQKLAGRTITSRIFTFKEDESSLFGRYILEKTEPSADKINVSVVRKFALNNGFKTGDTIKIGYFGIFLEFYVNEIIETPEAIQARANNYVWSDNTDFGYVYISEGELDKAVRNLAVLLEEKINESEDFRVLYEKTVNATGTTFPDIVDNLVEEGYTTKFTNQLLVKAEEGYTQEQVVENVKAYLDGKNIEVKSATENHNMFYYIYIESAVKQLQVAAIFLPVFFYTVTMIVIGLFLSQIIKAMTSEIGIMMSIGAGNWDIISIFVMFSFVMSLVAGVLGAILGIVMNRQFTAILVVVYSMPTIPFSVDVGITLSAALTLMVFVLITTLITCRRIFQITPKDAMISNEAKRKKLPPKLDRIIERSPMNVKLSLNSIAQNPRRFFVSTFSIFASFVIILLALFFFASKEELMDQSVNERLSFDAQVYMSSVASSAEINEMRSQPCVKEMLDCYYTYAELSSADGKKSTYIECLAFDENAENTLVVIPDARARGSVRIKGSGVVLPKSVADAMGVKRGDTIIINGVSVNISDVSFQYFHPVTYMSKTQMDELGIQYVSSFLVNVNDEDAFLEYTSGNNASLTVFTKNLSKDIHLIFNSIDALIYVMIAFSMFMGFIILSIMSQNMLMEQKRQLSVLRAIGFTIMDVSNVWTIQSVSELFLSALFGIPGGALSSVILFKLCSSVTQTYPFVFSVPMALAAFGFIFVIIFASHVLSMFTIKRWNLADNTRSRE